VKQYASRLDPRSLLTKWFPRISMLCSFKPLFYMWDHSQRRQFLLGSPEFPIVFLLRCLKVTSAFAAERFSRDYIPKGTSYTGVLCRRSTGSELCAARSDASDLALSVLNYPRVALSTPVAPRAWYARRAWRAWRARAKYSRRGQNNADSKAQKHRNSAPYDRLNITKSGLHSRL